MPCEGLRADVYAMFSFVPGPASSPTSRSLLRQIALRETMVPAPQIADGHVSIRFECGHTCDANGRWRGDSTAFGGTVVGPMSGVGRTGGLELSETVGAYFRPGCASRFFGVAASELADTAVAVGDLWGTRGSRLSSTLAGLNEAARIDLVESVLLAQLWQRKQRAGTVDVWGMAASVLRRPGRVTIDGMAHAAGVSRQHLSRTFRERIGIGPKLYSRLARFHAVLAHAGDGAPPDWASVAADLGFADQSHLIAECRQFSGLTPGALANCDWFHPFIERAKSRARG